MVWPGLVTRQQVFLATKTAIAAGLAWVAALAAEQFWACFARLSW
jgi:hypothetical protein